jgi:hypothetical protein
VSATYEKQKRYNRRKSAEVADVGQIPAVVNPERRAACERDLERFLVVYFPRSTGLKPFGDDHHSAIGRIQTCELDGGLFAQAFPRGGAKTTISENAVIHAILYGHRLFPVLFGADATAAAGNIDAIKTALSENDLLYDDFPEVCHPIRALEGKPQRCASQCHRPGNVEGRAVAEDVQPRQTHIGWTADTITLPTVYVPEGWGTVAGPRPDAPLVPSKASGTIIATRGLKGGARGLKHARPDGTQQRPDFVLIDDPQTDESASTPLQVDKRLNIIRKSILKLGGHSRKIAAVMNATVIRPDDLVEQIMDPKKFPAWQSVRIKMVKKWADAHETLWLTDYTRLRNTYDPDILGDQHRAHRAATEFYSLNREKMDAGCVVFWDHCYDDETELSAIQHAYNLFIDDGPDVFASECQNEPLKERVPGEQDALTADQILQKLNRLPRGTLPAEASRLVIMVDVHDKILYWMAAGIGDNFAGAVVDYGTWPDQKKREFAHRDVKRRTLATETGKKTLEAQIWAGLEILSGELTKREWKREDGAILKPERILADAKDGDHAEAVKGFCRRGSHAAVMLPSNGLYVGAKRLSLNDGPPVTGERRGWNWRIKPGHERVVQFDTNAWKTRMFDLLGAPMGSSSGLSLFGKEPAEHRMLVDHLTSEYPVKVEARRVTTEWSLRPNRDNHYLDCFVGCGVAASILGCDLLPKAVRKPRKTKAVSYLN